MTRFPNTLFSRLTASPASFQVSAAALVASAVWVVAVLVWGI
jgi:hypothetical protein